jgi:hypothetical protein
MSFLKKYAKRLWVAAFLAVILVGCTCAGNFAWLDENGNGIQDSGEPGVSGVQIRMTREGDPASAFSATTRDDGKYTAMDTFSFSGTYSMLVIPPGGYQFTIANAGSNDTVDSDVDPATGQVPPFYISGDNSTIDIGLIPAQEAAQGSAQEQSGAVALTPTPLPTATPTVDPASAAAAAAAQQVCYGPEQSSFPEGISPLSGLPVSNPALLALRPVFLSVSIFPASVRPPTGLAQSPIIYQLYIGDGDTRLMAGFYGEYPQPAFEGASGDSEQPEGFDIVIGDRVWFDSNGNHLQDEGEGGVVGVPVHLVDINLNTVDSTETDSTGHYYFGLNDVAENTEYQVRFGSPPSIADYYWVNKDAGDDDIDSDVTALGRTDFFDPTETEGGQITNIDAGLREAVRIEALRSGRVAYQDLQVNYCGCLVTAGADPAVAAQINTCGSAFGNGEDIGSAGLDVTRLEAIASNSTTGACAEPNLSGNLYCTQPQGEGEPGQELYVEYNVNNKDHFVYDASTNAYSWSKNTVTTPDVYDLMTDRLTGDPLTFENVVVLFVNHIAQNEAVTIINLQMQSARGRAVIFRNGQKFEAEWSTQFPDYVTDRDQPIPVHFEVNGEPFAMAPGQTWINLLNQGDSLTSIGSGIWLADFDAPAYTP